MSGTPTFGPYAPCDITLSRLMFAASREIHAVSASRSNVIETADVVPDGHVMGGFIVILLSEGAGTSSAPRIRSR